MCIAQSLLHTFSLWLAYTYKMVRFVVAVFISFVVFFSILSIRSLCFRRFGRLPRFWWWYYVCSSSIFHRLYSIKTPKIGFYCGDIRFRIDGAMMCCLVCRVCVFIGSLSSLNIQCLPNCLANAHTTFAVGIVVVVFAFSFFRSLLTCSFAWLYLHLVAVYVHTYTECRALQCELWFHRRDRER